MTATRNILFICLDSTRYDTFEASDARNMKNIGPLKKVHSTAGDTVPSMIAYLSGSPPFGTGRKDLFRRGAAGHFSWAPKFFSELGWVTAWLSSNPRMLALDSGFSGGFRRHFKHFKSIGYLKKFVQDGFIVHVDGIGPGHFSATPEIVADVEEIMKIEEGRSVFMTILAMDTHTPYNFSEGCCDIDPNDPEKNFRNQVRAIEYFDGFFPRIVDQFRGRGKTDIIITADHGELFGPGYWSHGSTALHVKFDEKLYEVPFIVGEIP